MIGQLKFDAHGRGEARREDLYGLRVLRAWTDPAGWLGDHRLRRAGRSLRRGGAFRVVAPPGFGRWELLKQAGLIPLDPCPFLRAQGARLALGCLERHGVAPDRATVALVGGRADRDMVRVASELCPKVRRLVIDAPRGGAELAQWLRAEFGIPVLPQQAPGEVAVRFGPEEEGREEPALNLYGPKPELDGLTLWVPGLQEEDQAHLPLLAALWEGGRLESEELKIT